jgi:hypothetical protein
MGKTRPGCHKLHVEVSLESWRILQTYTGNSPEKISASAILNALLESYLDLIKDRLGHGPSLAETPADIQRVAKLIANRIEPSVFPPP